MLALNTPVTSFSMPLGKNRPTPGVAIAFAASSCSNRSRLTCTRLCLSKGGKMSPSLRRTLSFRRSACPSSCQANAVGKNRARCLFGWPGSRRCATQIHFSTSDEISYPPYYQSLFASFPLSYSFPLVYSINPDFAFHIASTKASRIVGKQDFTLDKRLSINF